MHTGVRFTTQNANWWLICVSKPSHVRWIFSRAQLAIRGIGWMIILSSEMLLRLWIGGSFLLCLSSCRRIIVHSSRSRWYSIGGLTRWQFPFAITTSSSVIMIISEHLRPIIREGRLLYIDSDVFWRITQKLILLSSLRSYVFCLILMTCMCLLRAPRMLLILENNSALRLSIRLLRSPRVLLVLENGGFLGFSIQMLSLISRCFLSDHVLL